MKKKDYELLLQLSKKNSKKLLYEFASPQDEDNSSDELEMLIAEGEGKVKRKNYQVSYKTGTKSILCKRYVKLGQCPNGDKCEYAHSKKELQFNSPHEWVELIKHISN